MDKLDEIDALTQRTMQLLRNCDPKETQYLKEQMENIVELIKVRTNEPIKNSSNPTPSAVGYNIDDQVALLLDRHGKHGKSNITNTFILFCLDNVVRGRKKTSLHRWLHKGRLPLEVNTLTTKLGRLKDKGLLEWNAKKRPQVFKVTDQGKIWYNQQLEKELGHNELETFRQAVDYTKDLLLENGASISDLQVHLDKEKS